MGLGILTAQREMGVGNKALMYSVWAPTMVPSLSVVCRIPMFVKLRKRISSSPNTTSNFTTTSKMTHPGPKNEYRLCRWSITRYVASVLQGLELWVEHRGLEPNLRRDHLKLQREGSRCVVGPCTCGYTLEDYCLKVDVFRNPSNCRIASSEPFG